MPPVAMCRHDTRYVLEALAKLDEVYQTPVALFYLRDCSYTEIAEVLEVPLGTVKSRLARGVGRLQEMLAGEAWQPGPKRTNL
jgi:RNA polymerase sigma-70 factor (ECF subfamily)